MNTHQLNTLLVIAGLVVLVIFGAVIFGNDSEPSDTSDSDVVSTNGMHRHPRLSIVINGQEQDIPANIGLGVVHNPIHTHEADGTIHLEFSGLVRTDDIRLGEFFDVWGKRFTRECIFSHCVSSGGDLVMLVNGATSTAYREYVMQDGDEIEIRYSD